MSGRALFVAGLVLAVFAGGCAGRQADLAEQARLEQLAVEEEQRRLEADLEAQRLLSEELRQREEAARREEEQRRLAEETARARSVLLEIVYFEYDRADLGDAARELLLRKVPILRANPELRVRIEGHCDERGSIEYNLALGERRANAVRDLLLSHQALPAQLQVVSLGKERPADRGTGEAAWARNRRAEFQITAGGEQIRMR